MAKREAAKKWPLSARDIAFWRAYLEILNERVPLVDHWPDGGVTWHPRVVQKIVWYSGTRDTKRNRFMAVDWLMENVAVYADTEQIGAQTRRNRKKEKLTHA
jgi:hypothetical protein